MVAPVSANACASVALVRSADGVRLAVEQCGPDLAPTLLLAHGFGQTRHAWAATAQHLAARGYRCLSFDARGHGDSDRTADGDYAMQQFIDDLAGLARAQPQPPVLVGASMGGLLGLVAAGEERPPPFAALVLVDITPRWEPRGVERILAFMRAHPDGFASYDDAAAAIAAYLPQRRGTRSRQRLRPLLRSGDDGRLRWHWDPALLERIGADGERHQPRILAAARRIGVPVLLLSGGRSDVVSATTVDEFLQLVPHARHVELADATHMVAGDANDAFTREIESFIASLPPASRAQAAVCSTPR